MKIEHIGVLGSVLLLLLLGWQLTPESPVSVEQQPARAVATLIRGVRVFDGERLWPRADVQLRDGRIAAIGESLPPSADSEVVDGAGHTLLPGLIDAHVHSFASARRDALRFGVTTQLDMFSDHRQLAAARQQRASLLATRQADLWSAGTLATAAGGHGTQFGMVIPTVDHADDADAWVVARLAEGSDFIKLVREDLHVYSDSQRLPSLDAATAAAVIAAAHAHGVRAVVHASAQQAARESLRDGADGLVHIFQDLPADAAFIALARERAAFVVPTLSVIAGFAGETSDLLDDARIAPWLSAEQIQSIRKRYGHGDGNAELIANARASVRRLHAAGVNILAGTDAPNPNTAHGASLHEELAQLVRARLTPLQALAAATAKPAQAFALVDRGRIAAGLRADLILVAGDPSVDITATRAIVTVWKNGVPIDRRPPTQAATAPLLTGVIGAFDEADAGFDAWSATTDALMGGQSTVQLSRIDVGAGGSAGALRLNGEVVDGSGWPWAGAMRSFSTSPMQPMDARAASQLVLQARGDGRDYQVLLFSGSEAQQPPAVLTVQPGRQWGEMRVNLAEFAGADLQRVRAVAITAGAPAGPFQLDIDAVEIR